MSAVEYPVSLAVEDFVPVLLTTTGVLLLRRCVAHGWAALAAAVLIGTGGFAKATAKLIAATDGPDLPWLRGMLFPFLTLGFGLLCLELASTDRSLAGRGPSLAGTGRMPRWPLVLVPVFTVVCALGAVAAADPLPMLVSTTVFATLSGIFLIDWARTRGDSLAAALIGIQLLVFFILGPLASRPDQTVALQWAEQLCNTAAQAAFLIATWRLSAAPVAATDEELIS